MQDRRRDIRWTGLSQSVSAIAANPAELVTASAAIIILAAAAYTAVDSNARRVLVVQASPQQVVEANRDDGRLVTEYEAAALMADRAGVTVEATIERTDPPRTIENGGATEVIPGQTVTEVVTVAPQADDSPSSSTARPLIPSSTWVPDTAPGPVSTAPPAIEAAAPTSSATPPIPATPTAPPLQAANPTSAAGVDDALENPTTTETSDTPTETPDPTQDGPTTTLVAPLPTVAPQLDYSSSRSPDPPPTAQGE